MNSPINNETFRQASDFDTLFSFRNQMGGYADPNSPLSPDLSDTKRTNRNLIGGIPMSDSMFQSNRKRQLGTPQKTVGSDSVSIQDIQDSLQL